MGKNSEYSCQYGEYEPFAGRTYPRHILCTEGAHPGIEVRVLELAVEPSPAAALFDPPTGAKELANCPSKIQAPTVLETPAPLYPDGENQPNSPEVLQMIVGINGKPRDLKVVRSIGRPFDQPALDAVSRWIFSPAKCDGHPVPVPINVEVAFRKW
jgi:protein TonB